MPKDLTEEVELLAIGMFELLKKLGRLTYADVTKHKEWLQKETFHAPNIGHINFSEDDYKDAFMLLNLREDVQLTRGLGITAHYKYAPLTSAQIAFTLVGLPLVIVPTTEQSIKLAEALQQVVNEAIEAGNPLKVVDAHRNAEIRAGFRLKNLSTWGGINNRARRGKNRIWKYEDYYYQFNEDQMKALREKLESHLGQSSSGLILPIELTAPHGMVFKVSDPLGTILIRKALTVEIVVEE